MPAASMDIFGIASGPDTILKSECVRGLLAAAEGDHPAPASSADGSRMSEYQELGLFRGRSQKLAFWPSRKATTSSPASSMDVSRMVGPTPPEPAV